MLKLQKIFYSSLFIFTFVFANHFAYASEIDGIAAIVGSEIITKSQLEQQKQMLLTELQQANKPLPNQNQITKDALNNLIDMKLALIEAKKQEITISDVQLNKLLADIAAQNHMTVAQLSSAVIKQGINWNQYKKQMREQYIVHELQQRTFGSKLVVSKAEINAYLKKHAFEMQNQVLYHVQGLLVPTTQPADAAQIIKAKNQADTIANSLKAGTPFNTALVNASTGQGIQGGDLGWRPLAQLPPELAAAINQAKPGTVFGPISEADGFYIFQYVAQKAQPIDKVTTKILLRHILLETTNPQDSRIAAIQAALKQNKSFASLVTIYSADKISAKKGGELGWIDARALPPSVAKLANGQVSQPIASPNGIEIFQVVERKQVNTSPQDLANMAREAIYQQKAKSLSQTWLAELKKSAYIKIY
jgi:peptidyl-prolyl cis-trans isomerase SurA